MDINETRTLHPREILRQVAASMNGRYGELSVTLPAHTTWRAAIRAAEASLGDVDESIVITPPGAGSHSRRLRQSALRQVGEPNTLSIERHTSGLPIRTTVDLKSIGPPPRASENARNRIREAAKKLMEEEFRQPYVTLRAGIVEKRLPLIAAHITLQGLDASETDPICKLEPVEMIWDTGAHQTIVSEDMLSAEFQKYLKDPVHDPYRSQDGIRLQIEANIVFTNTLIPIAAVALVVPKEILPNQRSGILFGQTQCIDRLMYRSIPRSLLQAKGENVTDDIWGDIVVEEYLDMDDRIVIL